MQSTWRFYGRKNQIQQLEGILARPGFFFLKIDGRRRLGKTRLVTEVLKNKDKKVVFCKIQDAGEEALCEEWRVSLSNAEGLESVWEPSLRGFANSLKSVLLLGHLVVLDEFQYLSREKLRRTLDFLQEVVDSLRATENNLSPLGGLIVMGSIATELEDMVHNKHAPLFGRVTDSITLGHWDTPSLLEMWKDQLPLKGEALDPDEYFRLLAPKYLSYWNIFEGVPKFYQDAKLKDVLGADQSVLVTELFLTGNAPLAVEGEQWFLRELRGNYWPILKYVAEHEGHSHSDILEHIASLSRSPSHLQVHEEKDQKKKQIGGYLQGLERRFELVESRSPLFSKALSRKRKYYIQDRFLRAYLCALSNPIRATLMSFDRRLALALSGLETAEGLSFERLMRQTLMDSMIRGKGNIFVSSPDEIGGYWSKNKKVVGDIDVCAVSLEENLVWAISCKRNSENHTMEIMRSYHLLAEDLVNTSPDLKGRKMSVRFGVASPVFTAEQEDWYRKQGWEVLSLAKMLSQF